MDLKNRIRILNSQPVRPGARYVLYWAQMNRRVEGNHALLHAAELANSLGLPVLYYEGLTCSYPYANDRLHTFILEGVPDTEQRLRKLGIGYVFHLRRRQSDPDDVLYRLAKDAAAVVTDDYPTFVAARHNASVPAKVGVAYHVVDSSCVVPMGLFGKREYAAYTIRPKIRRVLGEHLVPPGPLKVRARFADPVAPFHTTVDEARIPRLVAECEIDHSVPPSISFHGGRTQAERHLERFVRDNLRRYARHRNEPSAHATSDLSPYLHFGNISSIEVALRVGEHASEHKLVADEYLEELIVRRELAFNFARHTPPPYTLECLPDWARATLAKHGRDERSPCYTCEQFERAETHDELWNATQKELLLRGKIHGYYRMYWGKKVIEWSAAHEDALETMIHLHDRYALDGRDPNTYANILWCFGLHDRPWSERPVFGTVRYMSLDGMKRKTDVGAYLAEIAQLERTGQDPFRLQ
ncbi:MAG TPA: deoxyribodipyrimidine photo-lyase [Bryobacteraceae bacterium]|nr:deoxyribodipyrimidine photo-lyase [Bryobacteraceae bacterium]